jgi:hypothetical protein
MINDEYIVNMMSNRVAFRVELGIIISEELI